ncbi:MAG: TonB-dependent receptor [Acidobacteria bacterium]|nr:TonB-dependent receptor [Acidobacteriota bacterium]
MSTLLKTAQIFVFVLISFGAVIAQQGTLTGTIKSQLNGELIPGVSVEIKKLNLSTETNENGKYEFTGIPDGTYTIVTHTDGFADKAQTVTVTSGAATLDFELSLKSINAEVTISATGEEQSVYESFSSVNSVGSTRIAEKASTSVGEVLENEAGVSVRSFGGGGSGRPSIRGFEGDRVLILQDGVRNGSIGAGSGDHGEPVATTNLERLEVIKGPATLLYGSNAIGGVVNAVTDDEDRAHEGVRGYFTALGGSVNRQAGIAGGLEYGFGKNLFELNLNSTREGDFHTPLGQIPNSASAAHGGSGSYGYFADKAFFRTTLTLDRRRYGIPYAPLYESRELLSIINGGIDCTGDAPPCQYNINELKRIFSNQLPPVPDEQVDIKMRRNNYRFVGGFRDLKSPVESGTFTVDFTDYRHQEIETANGTDSVATTFDNDVFSYRGIFGQSKYNKLSGQFGFEGYRRSYLTQGAEQLIDGRVRQNNFSVFALEEISFERVAIQFGGRLETNRYRPTNPALNQRDFTGFSGAIGARFEAWKGGSFVANFASSYRPPALEELYNNGPHVGTVTFEVGNENLTRERSNGIEFSFRQNSSRVRFNGSVFYNDISNFMYLAPLDQNGDGQIDIEDGLPIAEYLQNDSRFYGADATLDVDINQYVGVFFVGDIVKAKLKNPDVSLPRITPARGRFGLDLKFKSVNLRPEILLVGKRGAGDIFTIETPTAGYGVFNINGSYAFTVKNAAHIITFGGQNLGNKLYRNHVNFLKDIAPERGRGFKVSYTLRFF